MATFAFKPPSLNFGKGSRRQFRAACSLQSHMAERIKHCPGNQGILTPHLIFAADGSADFLLL